MALRLSLGTATSAAVIVVGLLGGFHAEVAGLVVGLLSWHAVVAWVLTLWLYHVTDPRRD